MNENFVTQWPASDKQEWLRHVEKWLTEDIPALGLGEVQQTEWVRERHWSAVIRITTSNEVVYFKAGASNRRNEPRLLRLLGRSWANHLPSVLAADESRSWMLMADHGVSVLELARDDDEVLAWDRLLPTYAAMQRSSAESVDWTAHGLPDRGPSNLPRRLAELLFGGNPSEGHLPLDSDELHAAEQMLPLFEKACDKLASTGCPTAIDHGDLHSGNLLVRSEELRLADWGDACVTHPFCSLLVTYQLSLRSLSPGRKRSAAIRMRDIYLDSWSHDASRKSLEELFDLALWAGHVVRALDWMQLLDGSDREFNAKWRGHIADLLRAWLRRCELLRVPAGIIEDVL